MITNLRKYLIIKVVIILCMYIIKIKDEELNYHKHLH